MKNKIVFLLIICISIMLCVNITAFADEIQNEAADTDMLYVCGIFDRIENSDKHITRAEAVEAILHLAGVTSDMAKAASEMNYYHNVYNDVWQYNICGGYIFMSNEYISNGVAEQEFKPNEVITLDESVTFMIRCIEKNKDISLTDGMITAEKNGLLYKNDTFYSSDGKRELKGNEFAVLLDRMFEQPKGYIWGRGQGFENGNEGYINIPIIDFDSVKTYRDNFTLRKNADEPNKCDVIADTFKISLIELENLMKYSDELFESDMNIRLTSDGMIQDSDDLTVKDKTKLSDYNRIAACMTTISDSILKKTSRGYFNPNLYGGYVYQDEDVFVYSDNERMNYGILYKKRDITNLKIPFIKEMNAISEDRWYAFDTYRD